MESFCSRPNCRCRGPWITKDHTVRPRVSFSPHCCLFRKGQTNPETTHTNKTPPMLLQRKSLIDRIQTKDRSGCAQKPDAWACKYHTQRATNDSALLPHTHSCLWLGVTLWSVGSQVMTSVERAAWGKSSRSSAAAVAHIASHVLESLPRSTLLKDLWHPRRQTWYSAGTTELCAGVLRKMDHPSLASGCYTLLIMALAWPRHFSYREKEKKKKHEIK